MKRRRDAEIGGHPYVFLSDEKQGAGLLLHSPARRLIYESP